ncbi:MAG: cupin domain-containing protein, partial [Chloroflexi bacterium]|nr:cupin domain-containing protein [Chloroflexota bacterium]
MDLKVIDSQSSPWLPHRKYTGVYARSVVDSAISSDLEVREVRITPGAEISLHTHEGSAETFYVLSGTGTVYTGSESVPCQPGSCF